VFYRNVGGSDGPRFAEGVAVTGGGTELVVEAEGCLGVSVAVGDLDGDGVAICGMSSRQFAWGR